MTNDGGGTEQIPGLGDIPQAAPADRRPPAAKKPAPKKGARQPAEDRPVARVAVDVPLAHLDRPFDYLVPSGMDASAVPGCRVRVRFAGQLVDGFLLERAAESDHTGRLSFLERVTSPEPVLTPEIAALCREVADRYAGTFTDVVRLAVPPRHARAEAEQPPTPPEAGPPETASSSDAPGQEGTPAAAGPSGAVRGPGGAPAAVGPSPAGPDLAGLPETVSSDVVRGPGGAPAVGGTSPAGPEAAAASDTGPSGVVRGPGGESAAVGTSPAGPEAAAASDTGVGSPGVWGGYPAGRSFLAAVAEGRAPRAVWTALPGPSWTEAIAVAVAAALRGGRGALVVVADGRDVARVDAALAEALGEGAHVALTAELGPAERYRRWLAVLRGSARAVVGTRAAMFAPVADLGLAVLWDDGDDVHAEPHAPYPHPREVLALRALRAGAGLLIGGFTRTTEATALVESGWAHALAADRERIRAWMPRVRPVGDDGELARDGAARTARLTELAFTTARRALADGPVLVQVPRRGYLPALACVRCRTPARCSACQGPLALTSAHATPYCRWCGRIAGDWGCGECGARQVRAVMVGARRTAEELGRAFPGVPLRTSGREGVLDRVGDGPALVVSTPGAEPVADGGYAAALLLDGWVLLGRADLRAGEETLRRWMNAAALVRPSAPVVVVADGALPAVQALLRWDPVTYAGRELEERREAGFPPAVRMASLTGSPAAVRELLSDARLPEGAEVLGPVPVADKERALVRVQRRGGLALARALQAAQGVRSARKAAESVRVEIDPLELI